MTATKRTLLTQILAAGWLVGAASAGLAQNLDIDSWPGLAGQPQARRDLITEYIRIPSAAHPPGTPNGLNQTNFVRVRNRTGNPNHVDAILIQAIPSIASSFTESAAQLIEMAALRGKSFEVWGIERREKNLQDIAGMRQAIIQHDASVALRYYYGDKFLDANGKFAGKLGGSGAKFVPLQQSDVPFLADWDAEVFNRDVESILALIPPNQRRTNVFLYSASSGGYFLSQFAGFKLLNGNRGYQEIAGLIAIEGELTKNSIGSGEPTEKDVSDYIEKVQAIRNGSTPRFPDVGRTSLLTRGQILGIPDTILLLAAEFAPSQESIFPLVDHAVGGPAADAFNAKLRLTNLARAGYTFSDDPLPGSFTMRYFVANFGGGIGHLDFAPLPGVAACAEPGPLGLKPPCVPSVNQIDPLKVYGWADGGPGGPAVAGNPLQGWTITPEGAFTSKAAHRGPNPGHILTAVQMASRPATLTNATPLTIALPTGTRTIDSSFNIGLGAWYLSSRYYIDVAFINRFQKILIDRPDLHIHLDFDKTAIDIPIIEYVVHRETTNPWPNESRDFTVVDLDGLTLTPLAAQKSPMNPAVNLRLYKNLDIHAADNSDGAKAFNGVATPGNVGANPISDTLPDWVIARMGNTGIDLPTFKTHPSANIP